MRNLLIVTIVALIACLAMIGIQHHELAAERNDPGFGDFKPLPPGLYPTPSTPYRFPYAD